MKLYYAPGACSLADHIAIEEAGLAADLVKVDLKDKTTETGEDYHKINPKGYVPALALDNGETLTENIAVLLYIAARSGKLLPAEDMPRWRVIETTAFVSTELHNSFKPFFVPGAGEAAKDDSKTLLADRFQRMADLLGDRAFIVGEEMSIADCYLFVMLLWAIGKFGLDVPAPLKDYLERLKRRPAVVRALAAEGLG